MNEVHPGGDNVLLVDKEVGWTSFDVIKKLRGLLHQKKIGHAGTLDPLASGLLIVCTGKNTKLIHQYMDLEKEYMGTMVLGKTTPSCDLETSFDSSSPIDHLSHRDVEEASRHFQGDVMQEPPLFSAIRVKGKRAYKHARKGEDLKLAPRPVTIFSFELTKIALPEVQFNLVCSKGFYVRSLVRDFGKFLGVGAHLSALRRLRIGPHHVQEALSVGALEHQLKSSAE